MCFVLSKIKPLQDKHGEKKLKGSWERREEGGALRESRGRGTRRPGLLLEMMGRGPCVPLTQPVRQPRSQQLSHLFCGRLFCSVWWCFVLLLLCLVLSAYLRELRVWFCSNHLVLKGFIIPRMEHKFGHLGRDREMQPLNRVQIPNI